MLVPVIVSFSTGLFTHHKIVFQNFLPGIETLVNQKSLQLQFVWMFLYIQICYPQTLLVRSPPSMSNTISLFSIFFRSFSVRFCSLHRKLDWPIKQRSANENNLSFFVTHFPPKLDVGILPPRVRKIFFRRVFFYFCWISDNFFIFLRSVFLWRCRQKIEKLHCTTACFTSTIVVWEQV